MKKYSNSLKTYSLTVISLHVLLIVFFFPMIVFYTIFIFSVFVASWAWCDLVHHIEQANRNEILGLLHTCTNDKTKDALAYQLFLHDKNSVFGDPNRL